MNSHYSLIKALNSLSGVSVESCSSDASSFEAEFDLDLLDSADQIKLIKEIAQTDVPFHLSTFFDNGLKWRILGERKHLDSLVEELYIVAMRLDENKRMREQL